MTKVLMKAVRRRFSLAPQGFMAIVIFLSGCSGSDQSSSLSETYESVQWYFNCPTENPIPLPSPGESQLVLADEGPYLQYRERLIGTPVTVFGKICPPIAMMRDVVFIIDVSGSMSSNDPVQEIPDPPPEESPENLPTCGRYKGLLTVLENLPQDVAQFAVVTFDDHARDFSDKFYGSKDELFAQLSNNGQRDIIRDIICRADDGTSYRAALIKAKELFQHASSRKYATKELFFISDGEPNSGQNGRAEAIDLKTNGVLIDGQKKLVTIATVMLEGDEAQLRALASLDSDGNPIHAKVDDADALEAILDEMSRNELIGSQLRHGGNDSTSFSRVDITAQSDQIFQLDPFPLDINGSQSAYELYFEYWDKHLNTFQAIGRLQWLDEL